MRILIGGCWWRIARGRFLAMRVLVVRMLVKLLTTLLMKLSIKLSMVKVLLLGA